MSDTQAVPPAVVIARTALADVLVAEPDDLDVRLAVSRALAQLEDVDPPYPPLEYPPGGNDADVRALIRDARQHLRCAVDTAETVEQAVACAAAARTLLPLLRATGPA